MSTPHGRPKNAVASFSETKASLTFVFPNRGGTKILTLLPLLCFGVLWSVVFAQWVVGGYNRGSLRLMALMVLMTGSGIIATSMLIWKILGYKKLLLDAHKIYLSTKILGIGYTRSAPLAAIEDVHFSKPKGRKNVQKLMPITIRTNDAKRFIFGRGLATEEKLWIIQKIREFIASL